MEDDDDRFPKCVLDPRCVLFFGHEGVCLGRVTPVCECLGSAKCVEHFIYELDLLEEDE